MKYKVLIVDDELDRPARSGTLSRRQIYKHLEPQFELIFLEEPNSLPAILRSTQIHAVLLDFILDGWRVDRRSLLKILDDNFPVFLISSHWGPNFDDLR